MKTRKSITEIFILVVFFMALLSCVTAPTIAPLQKMSAQVVLKEPENPECWVEYGRASMFSNNPNGAEMAFKQALELNKNYLPAYKHLGVVLVNLQRYQDAEKVYEQALQICSKDSALLTAYGYCLVDSGKEKEALEVFRRSIKSNADPLSVVSARLGASALLHRQGDEVSAKAEYKKAFQAGPEIVRMLSEQKEAQQKLTKQP